VPSQFALDSELPTAGRLPTWARTAPKAAASMQPIPTGRRSE